MVQLPYTGKGVVVRRKMIMALLLSPFTVNNVWYGMVWYNSM
jgi:hypothetical protein